MVVDVLRISIGGALPGGEVWSVNPVFQILNSAQTPTAPQCLTIATAINAITLSSGLTSFWSTSTNWNKTRVEARTYNGNLVAQAEAPRSSAVVGTGATPHPFQTSIVVSLRSDFPGGQGRGRLYFPATGAAMTAATLRFNSGTPASALVGVKALLTAISGAITPTLGSNSLVVWSRVGAISHQITSLRAGDVADVQRRRRDSALELYDTTAWP